MVRLSTRAMTIARMMAGMIMECSSATPVDVSTETRFAVEADAMPSGSWAMYFEPMYARRNPWKIPWVPSVTMRVGSLNLEIR